MKAYKRSIFLIDRKFQIRFSVYVSLWILVLTFIYPLLINNLYDYFAGFLAQAGVAPSMTELSTSKQGLLTQILLMQIAFLLLSFLMSLFISHRIAGPLFKLKRFMNQIRTGQQSGPLYFRRSDHFQDVAESFNEMVAGLKQQDLSRQVTLGQSIDLIVKLSVKSGDDQSEEVRRVLEQLKSLRQG